MMLNFWRLMVIILNFGTVYNEFFKDALKELDEKFSLPSFSEYFEMKATTSILTEEKKSIQIIKSENFKPHIERHSTSIYQMLERVENKVWFLSSILQIIFDFF